MQTIAITSLQEGVKMKGASTRRQITKHQSIASSTKGFSLSETLIALAAGTLVIGGGATALQSMQTLIQNNGDKTAQRQNIANGVRLMRSEIERSLHTLVSGTPPNEELAYTDLGQYTEAIDFCRKKSLEENEGSFIPLFGLKMADVTGQPVIYGLSEGSSSRTFSVKRCGTQLGLDGRYDNSKDPFVASVIDGVGMMPCINYDTKEGKCLDKAPEIPEQDDIKPGEITATDILNYLAEDPGKNYYFDVNNENKTAARSYLEPAFRFATDENRKLIRVISPMDCDDSDPNQVCVDSTTINVSGSSESGSQEALTLTAYARADKRLVTSDESASTLGGDWFRDVNSKHVRFLVDGSGSMSACMAWSYKANGELEMGDTSRIFHTPKDDPLYDNSSYESSRAICHETRMERLQSELTELLLQLPGDTKISLEVFSTSGGENNRQWERSANGLVSLGDGDNRDSALAFVQSLDDPVAYTWGGTDPWAGLQRSFDDFEADSLYFLSDGLPTERLSISDGSDASYYNNYITASSYFSSQNANREKPLTVHSTAVKLNSEWMKELSDQTSGNYLQSQ